MLQAKIGSITKRLKNNEIEINAKKKSRNKEKKSMNKKKSEK